MLLENKNALITGSSRGIGASIAREMAKEGANVSLVFWGTEQDADPLELELHSLGVTVIKFHSDVSSFQDAARVVNETFALLGSIDILVNNAGINADAVSWKMTEEQWDRVLDVNLKGYFNYIRHCAPLFKQQQSGKIINITSINGLRGKFGQLNYAAAKAGVVGLTKTMAKELGAFFVNVNAIAPGLIETDMIKNSDAREKIIEGAMNEMAIKRVGQPEDIANLAVFLASEKAVQITGQIIQVDGGGYI